MTASAFAVDAETRASERRAIGLILTAAAAFSTQDVMVKLIVERMSVWQMQFLRSLFVAILLIAAAAALGKLAQLRPKGFFWPVVRACFMCGAYLGFYGSLPYLTLAQAGAAFFTGPLFITLFAALILKEPIGPRRIVAVVVGFLGVLAIVRPGAEGASLAALAPAVAAASYALGVIVTRWRCRADPSFSLSMTHTALYASIGALGVLVLDIWPVDPAIRERLPALTAGWAPVAVLSAVLLAATAATHLTGMLSAIRAYQLADAARIAPFEYFYLALAPLWDVVFFGRWPDGWTLLGVALIAGAGVFVAWREGRPARPRSQNFGEIPWTPDPSGSRPPNDGS